MDNNDYIEFEGVRRYQPDALHKRMLQRIAELENKIDWYRQECEDLRTILAAELVLLDEEIDERIAALHKVQLTA